MTNILNFPRVIVENEIQTIEILIFTVKLSKKTAICPRCDQTRHRLHQNPRHLVRDLLICDKQVIVKVNRRRFKCINCQKPFSESLDLVDKKKSFLPRYAETITKQFIHSDINNVAKNNKLTGDEVWLIVESVAEKILPIDVENLTRLGIDEIGCISLWHIHQIES
jgi:transposase